MNKVDYNNKKEKRKRIRQEIFDIRTRMELNKKDERKFSLWSEALKKYKKKMAQIKLDILLYEKDNNIKKK